MRFSVRNTFYLKISKYDVLPLYLYLDERHVDWMSERTLQYVISDLRPLVGPKLDIERNLHYGSGSSTKKGTVDVHRGDTYQFAYFLRKMVPHAVVMKTRSYVMVNNPRQAKHKTVETAAKRSKTVSNAKARQARTNKVPTRSSKKGKGKAVEIISDSEPETIEISDTDTDAVEEVADTAQTDGPRRRSTRTRKSSANYREGSDEQDEGEDVEVKEEEPETALDLTEEAEDEVEPMQTDTLMDEDEEEQKLKPKIQLSFRTLEMRDLCLCVVVEPWPIDSASLATSAGVQSHATMVPRILQQATLSASTPSTHVPNVGRERAETPLFLPDDDRGRSQTPAPAPISIRFSSVFNDLESLEGQEDVLGDEHGMMAFSQALNKVSGDRMGAAGEDEDEMDGGAMYGDADEMHDFLL